MTYELRVSPGTKTFLLPLCLLLVLMSWEDPIKALGTGLVVRSMCPWGVP